MITRRGFAVGIAAAAISSPFVQSARGSDAQRLRCSLDSPLHHARTRAITDFFQFTLGVLITLVQGPAPITDITPGLERLVGIVIASAVLCLTTLVWPLVQDQ